MIGYDNELIRVGYELAEQENHIKELKEKLDKKDNLVHRVQNSIQEKVLLDGVEYIVTYVRGDIGNSKITLYLELSKVSDSAYLRQGAKLL